MKLRTKKSPKGPFDQNTLAAVGNTLEQLDDLTDRLQGLREDNAQVFDEYDGIASEIDDCHVRLKAMVSEGARKFKEGTHQIASSTRYRVQATMRQNIDGNKLVKLIPKVLKVGRVKIGINQQEAQRLIAAGVITEKDLKEVTSLSPSISVKGNT